MTDNIFIDKSHLPADLKNHESGWKTSDYLNTNCTLHITRYGTLRYIKPEGKKDRLAQKCYYTGRIIFETKINGIKYQYLSHFKNGKMTFITQLIPIKKPSCVGEIIPIKLWHR